jgi:DNA-binding protein HU-beta
MTKAEFVKQLAEKADMTPADALRAVNGFWEVVMGQLKDGQDVQFAGFGKFSVSDRAAREGVNPREPGTRIQIPARRVPKFTPGAVLKSAVEVKAAAPAKKTASKTTAAKKAPAKRAKK